MENSTAKYNHFAALERDGKVIKQSNWPCKTFLKAQCAAERLLKNYQIIGKPVTVVSTMKGI